MTAIGNPILGPLHEFGWPRPTGNTEMKVTQDAAQHAARILNGVHRAMALDIGDGNPDLDAILAPHDGVIAEASSVGSANLAIDFDSGGKRWRIVLAHNTLPHPVKVGDQVREVQQVGRMGKTGATAIHLHMQLGYWDGTKWVWVDPWVYLRQNGAIDDEENDMLKGTNPVAISNRRTTVLGNDTNFRAAPATGATPKLTQFPADTLFDPDYTVQGGAVKDQETGVVTTGWYAGWGTTPKGIEFGYMHESVVGTLSAIESTGHSDEELAEAANGAAHGAAVAVETAASAAAAQYPA